MSVPTTLQSRLIPMAISTDGVTYRNVVCKRAMNFNGTTPTNQEDTDCGSFVALNANQWTFDFEGVFNTTPNADEYSAEQVLGFWAGQTLLYIKVQYPTSGTPGADIYIQGNGYLTSYTLTTNTGNLVSYSFTFTGNGDPDVSA